MEKVYEFVQKWEPKRNSLSFQVDGMVIIVNNIESENKLGVVGKAPRWATAFKFAPEQTTTIVEDIRVSLGRTGALTPYAVLKPVRIAGSTVSRATLHNEDEIKRKDIRIGDTVIVQKAGDIIPEVIKPIITLRTGKEKVFKMPHTCPICGGKVLRPKGEAVTRCVNTKCWAIEKEKIIHFVSKDAFNIEGMGEQIVEQFIENGLIANPADIFSLKEEDIESQERFAEKSAQNLIDSISKSKIITLPKFIFALGIRHVGAQTAQMLSNEFKTLENLKNAGLRELENLQDIGPIASKSIFEWFRNKANIKLLEDLRQLGVKTETPKTTNELQGKTFVITGTLEKHSREKLEDIIITHGGKVASSVSANTNFLILGENPGSKYEKAKKYGVSIISEDDFLKMI